MSDNWQESPRPDKQQRLEPASGGGGGGGVTVTVARTDSTVLPVAQPTPPAFNRNDKAFAIFSDLYFYEDSTHDANEAASRREDCLGEMTIKAIYLEYIVRHLNVAHLAIDIKAASHRVKAYFCNADIPTKQDLARNALGIKYNCAFKTCSIKIGDALKPLLAEPREIVLNNRDSVDVENTNSDVVAAGGNNDGDRHNRSNCDEVDAVNDLGNVEIGTTNAAVDTARVKHDHYDCGSGSATKGALGDVIDDSIDKDAPEAKIYSDDENEGTIKLSSNDDNRTIDLTFLDTLRALFRTPVEELFMPKKLYVRDCMREIFGLIREDVKEEKSPPLSHLTVLVGSPGIGKSVLLFLAALYRAQEYPVVYLRKLRSSRPSVFIMTLEVSGDIRVWFSQNMQATQGLASLKDDLRSSLCLDDTQYYTFLDGPQGWKDQANPDLLDGAYDYLCPSGGWVSFQVDGEKNRLWILDAWTEREASQAFTSDAGDTVDKKKMKRVYDLCGGNMRDMTRAWLDYERIKSSLRFFVRNLSAREVKLALTSTEWTDEDGSCDRVQCMFADRNERGEYTNTRRMTARSIIDSKYILSQLWFQADLKDFLNAHNLTASPDMGSVEGTLFEHMIYTYVSRCTKRVSEQNALGNVGDVCRSEGTGAEGVAQLDKPKVYWIPSVSNFANIDSAFIYDNMMYVLQITIRATLGFSKDTFKKLLLDRVQKKGAFISVQEDVLVHFVVPTGTGFSAQSNGRGFLYDTIEVIAGSSNPNPHSGTKTKRHIIKLRAGPNFQGIYQ